MAKTAAFHGRISAGIDCKLKIVIYVFTEQGAMESPETEVNKSGVQRPSGCSRHPVAKQRFKLHAKHLKTQHMLPYEHNKLVKLFS